MSVRYSLATLSLALAGGFVVVTTFAFASGTANAVNFAVSIAVTLGAVATAVLASGAPRSARATTALIGLIGAFTILVTLGIFSGEAQRWIVFGGGAAISALALAVHVAHDVVRARGATARPVGVTSAKAA